MLFRETFVILRFFRSNLQPVELDTLAEKIANGGAATVVTEGKDALLTCVIMGAYSNDTVLWRRSNNEIVAAGTNRVISDRRFSVLHDDCKLSIVDLAKTCGILERNVFFVTLTAPKTKGASPNGGDVWVLVITDAQPNDSDLYVCEVNTDPPIRSFHGLKGKLVKCCWLMMIISEINCDSTTLQ